MTANRTLTNQDMLADALRVLTLNIPTRTWLEANDPMALKQAQDALGRFDREQFEHDEARLQDQRVAVADEAEEAAAVKAQQLEQDRVSLKRSLKTSRQVLIRPDGNKYLVQVRVQQPTPFSGQGMSITDETIVGGLSEREATRVKAALGQALGFAWGAGHTRGSLEQIVRLGGR